MEKINAENMIDLGKLNMDEFAMGGSTEYSYFKKTRNPWDLSPNFSPLSILFCISSDCFNASSFNSVINACTSFSFSFILST